MNPDIFENGAFISKCSPSKMFFKCFLKVVHSDDTGRTQNYHSMCGLRGHLHDTIFTNFF